MSFCVHGRVCVCEICVNAWHKIFLPHSPCKITPSADYESKTRMSLPATSNNRLFANQPAEVSCLSCSHFLWTMSFRTVLTVTRRNTPNWILIVGIIAQHPRVFLGSLVHFFGLHLLMELVIQIEFPLGKLYAHFLHNLLRLKALRSLCIMEGESALTTIVLILKMFCVSWMGKPSFLLRLPETGSVRQLLLGDYWVRHWIDEVNNYWISRCWINSL